MTTETVQVEAAKVILTPLVRRTTTTVVEVVEAAEAEATVAEVLGAHRSTTRSGLPTRVAEGERPVASTAYRSSRRLMHGLDGGAK